MPKFVKKPIPVDAVKCVKENEKEIVDLLSAGETSWDYVRKNGEVVGFKIQSWEGAEDVFYDPSLNKSGNGKPYWIIKGLKGECYTCVADDEDDAPLGYMPYKDSFAKMSDEEVLAKIDENFDTYMFGIKMPKD